jgi:hypothetical protein
MIVEEELTATVKIELGVFFDTATDGTNRAFFSEARDTFSNVTYRTVCLDLSPCLRCCSVT